MYVDLLQQNGRYTLTREEAEHECSMSPAAVKQAARRLVLQRRLAMPRRGFFVIVPLEYRSAGSPPPSWFIDALMEFHGLPYYVALLSAAALHGAAHQQPQEFQVITTTALRPAAVGNTRLRFLSKKRAPEMPTVVLKTETGSIRVATVEATVLDLVRYPQASGGLGNVATVYSELAEKIDPDRLAKLAETEDDLAIVQRAGFLLDHVGASNKTEVLARMVVDRRPRLAPLRAGLGGVGFAKDSRWRVLVNERVEVDE